MTSPNTQPILSIFMYSLNQTKYIPLISNYSVVPLNLIANTTWITTDGYTKVMSLIIEYSNLYN